MDHWFAVAASIGGVLAISCFLAVGGMFVAMMFGWKFAVLTGLAQTGAALVTAIVALLLIFGGWRMVFIAAGTVGLFAFLSVAVLAITLYERKVLARFHQRLGPMRVGPHGILQPLADAIKIVTKEDIMPAWTDHAVFWLAPIAFFIPTFLIWLVVPFADGWVVADMELGLLYLVAFSVLAIAGLFMAGWSSANKYSMIGGLRAIAQLISYEIPIIVIVITLGLTAGSLNISAVVNAQNTAWYILTQPLAFAIFFLAGLAEIGRTPFDIYHAESEVMGGPFLEYSGAHWAIFYLAEYINTFLLGVFVTLLFLGGWLGPVLPAILWFFIKVFAVIAVMFWFRGTFPRFRIDQLMSLGWKFLIPLAFVNFIVTAVVAFYGLPAFVLAIIELAALVGIAVLVQSKLTSPSRRPTLRLISARELRDAQ